MREEIEIKQSQVEDVLRDYEVANPGKSADNMSPKDFSDRMMEKIFGKSPDESGGEGMSGFTKYRRKQIAEMRPYEPGEDMTHISVGVADYEAGSPKAGDMIARNPENHQDRWLVSAKYFADNYEPV